ncbi:ribonuclease III [Amnibacterium soli]|uniref:ribonuclease III n=1 Tax=Amnibacterium soli TaxID=1282736 RepID=UPI0031F01A2A
MVATLGVAIDPGLLETALTHRSFAYEHGTADNERFEFLGDSVLQRAVTMMLFERYPRDDEGALAKRRAGLVSTVALASVARRLGLGEHLRLGRGEVLTRGAEKPSILADAVEALIGAAFLSVGSEQAEAFVLRLVQPLVDDPASTGAVTDPKTALQEAAAQRGANPPVYEVTGTGPEHARVFTATVVVGELVTATGTGTSKKQAEVAAAWEAYRALDA